MPETPKNTLQNDLVVINTEIDSLASWIEAYFADNSNNLSTGRPKTALFPRIPIGLCNRVGNSAI
jgi:hypothetical protein